MGQSSLDQILKRKSKQLFVKRLFDICFSLLGLTIMFLPMLLISLIIKIQSDGPVFFKQWRVGKNGQEFEIYKFRTMVVDAEKQGLQITVDQDPRITKIGHFLRRTKLDEFPQLLNVLKGDMSFVGPRPEVKRYVDLYTPEQEEILKVRPGITDLASIEYRDEQGVLAQARDPDKVYIEEIMPHKLSLNRKYIENFSLAYDIGLILKTLRAIV